MRSGWMRISGSGPSTASDRPRTSTPRGRQGSVLARSSMTIAARPLRATSRNFFFLSKSLPVTSTVSSSALCLHIPTGTTGGVPSGPTVAMRASRRSPLRYASSPAVKTLAGTDRLGLLAAEVLRRDVLEEVLELLDDLLGVLDLVLELDRGFGDDVLCRKDRRTRAHGERKRIAGPRVDLQLAPVQAQGDGRVEGVLPQLGDGHPRAVDVQLGEHLRHQVVGHRSRGAGALQAHEDRRRLRVADPDGQELVR